MNKPHSFDYKALRLVTGVVAFALPILTCLLYHWGTGDGLPSSISMTYHTAQCTGIFVGFLFIVFTALFSYIGRDGVETGLSRTAAVAAMFVALFPTDPAPDKRSFLGIMHLASAAVLFGILVYFCLVTYRINARDKMEDEPKEQLTRAGFFKGFLYVIAYLKLNQPESAKPARRMFVYYVCGFIMCLCMLMILATIVSENARAFLDPIRPVFTGEAVALIAFGIAWMTASQFRQVSFGYLAGNCQDKNESAA
jgi:protein-S-isoprenylcysteine O-methyltransferase Ste14